MISHLSKYEKRFKVKIKNLQIHKNMMEFIKDHGDTILPREVKLNPEVLIPCYNHGKYLSDALDSVAGKVPVTIIDDHSSDDTPEIIEELKKKHSFKLIHNENNLLQSGSLNLAINESSRNIFIILNADDCLTRFCIQTILDMFNRYTTIRMIGGNSISFSFTESLRLNDCFPDKLNYIPLPKIFNRETAIKYRFLNDINMSMSGSAFLRSAWESVGGFKNFSDRICSYDDRDFQMRVSALYDVAVINEPLCLYRTTSSLGKAEYI